MKSCYFKITRMGKFCHGSVTYSQNNSAVSMGVQGHGNCNVFLLFVSTNGSNIMHRKASKATCEGLFLLHDKDYVSDWLTQLYYHL